MKYKRQYVMTLTITAKSKDEANSKGKYFCQDIRGYAKNSDLVSVHSITPQSLSPKRLAG